MRTTTVLAAVAAAALLSATAALAARPDAPSAGKAAARAAAAHAAAPGRPDAASPSLVETAIAVNASGPFAGSFDTLIDLLVQYPDLVAVLSQKGQYTVFAPTDDAFDALFAAVAVPGGIEPDDLTPAVVKDVLLYHIAKGRRDASSVLGSSQIRMLNGDVARVGPGATIDGAPIVVTDVFASNGVIHAVGAVLLPPALS